MKKIRFLAMSVVFTLFIGQVSAQVRKQEKELKSEIKTEKKDIRGERSELRKLEGNVVSNLTKDNFHRDFGNVQQVKWTRTDYYDIAEFKVKGVPTKAFYDFDSELVGTTAIRSFSDLPAKGQKEIKKSYPRYTPGEVVFYDDNENNDTDMILYDTQFDDGDSYFVVLTKGSQQIVVKVNLQGEVFFFKKLK